MALPLLLLLPSAWAEGSDNLGGNQPLLDSTVIYVDIVDSTAETFTWTGDNDITVTDPDGTSLGTFSDGDEVVPTYGVDGAYEVALSGTEEDWDIEVTPSPSGGRVYAVEWDFSADGFEEEDALNASFYALVPTGSTDTAVVEMRFEGRFCSNSSPPPSFGCPLSPS